MKSKILTLALSLLTSLAIPSQGAEPAASVPIATPATDAAIANWCAKRFGMFIHWGPVTLTALPVAIQSAKLLNGAAIQPHTKDGVLRLDIPEGAWDSIDTIVELTITDTRWTSIPSSH